MYTEKRRILYSEIAPDQKASPAAILNFFQNMAIDHSTQVGCSLTELDKVNLAWLVISTRFKAARYPCYGEEVTIATWPTSFYKIFGERGYEILDKDGNAIISGSSLWLLFNKKKGGAQMVSDEMKGKYKILEKDILPVIRRDIKIPSAARAVKEFAVEKRDLDSNNHVNNVKYIEYAAEILPDNAAIKELEIYYRQGAKLGDVLTLYSAKEEGYIYGGLKNAKGENFVTMRFKTE